MTCDARNDGLMTRDAADAATQALLGCCPPIPNAPISMVLPAASDVTMDVLGVCEDAGYATLRSQLGRLANRRVGMAASAAALPTAIVVEDNGLEPVTELVALVDALWKLRRHPAIVIVVTTGDVRRFDGMHGQRSITLAQAA
jgi:hypothetical protein